ncbi:MAG: hypothetical protein II735_03650 [Clostridia bacterium]|nr:hypothetical protein [Clostridia bacterium]HCA54289.1 hypothetical protein [Oscillospiraceae bacterium]
MPVPIINCDLYSLYAVLVSLENASPALITYFILLMLLLLIVVTYDVIEHKRRKKLPKDSSLVRSAK